MGLEEIGINLDEKRGINKTEVDWQEIETNIGGYTKNRLS